MHHISRQRNNHFYSLLQIQYLLIKNNTRFKKMYIHFILIGFYFLIYCTFCFTHSYLCNRHVCSNPANSCGRILCSYWNCKNRNGDVSTLYYHRYTAKGGRFKDQLSSLNFCFTACVFVLSLIRS